MKTLAFIFCLLPLFLTAQVPNIKSKTVRSIYLMPDLMSLNYTMPERQQGWAPKAGIGVGAQVKLKIANNFFLRTGLGYGLKGYRNMETGLRFGTDIDPVKGFISESKIETKGVYHELQLPLALHCDIDEEKFFMVFGLDLVAQLSHTTKRQILYGNGTMEYYSFENKSQFNMVPTISMGYAIPINDHYSLSIAPTFRYYVKEWILLDTRLYNYGIKLLLDYKP